ncbi:phosphotransferase [Sneathiella marina]|uniref:Phosphotransferase n=1 Tax=Sneathiella marina TaxID=2950108 RepID=A0ABY4W9L2_9PROT|nr:phosphotransferase [Sneathiella marina]USG61331.1 phosphotransferase [Sneathiella marina]
MREILLNQFLQRNNLSHFQRINLAGDASTRRYERLTDQEKTFILMDAPPPETISQFMGVAKILSDRGYSPPKIYATDVENGFLLLEDLGDGLFARLIETGEDEEGLYKLAVDLLLTLRCAPSPSELPKFTDDYILSQNQMFLDWYVPDNFESLITESGRSDYEEIWRSLLKKIPIGPEVILLRDFHAENLLLLKGRKGVKALGLLDFQDALVGPAAYDLVSLLQDARRDVAPDVVAKMITYYIEETGLDERDFRASYAILGAHRALRILGIFTRLAKKEGKQRYLRLVPRMLHHLHTNLEHPELQGLKLFLDQLKGKKKDP